MYIFFVAHKHELIDVMLVWDEVVENTFMSSQLLEEKNGYKMIEYSVQLF